MIQGKPLGELCHIVRGSSPRPKGDPKYYGGSVPRLMVGDLTRDGKLVTPQIDFLTDKGALKSRPMKAGNMVIAVSGQPGMPAILNVDACIHDGFAGLRDLDNKQVDKDYLYLYLIYVKDKNANRAVGAIFKNLTTDQLRELFIPLPPLKEQKRIAAILGKADAIRHKRQQAIDLTDQLLRSVFLDMFGDPVTNRKDWDVKILESACRKITDGTHHSPESREEGIYYITAKHVKPNKLDFYSNPTYVSEEAHKKIYARCNPELNDILYIKDGATTGIATINPYGFEFSMLSSLALIKVDEKQLLPEYLCDWLNFESVKERILKNISGAAITRLTIRKIKDLTIELPPIELQKEYLKFRSKIVESQTKLSNSTKNIENLFFSLTKQAFLGELTKQIKPA